MMTAEKLVLRFDAPDWVDNRLLKYLAAFLSGTLGQKLLSGLLGRWRKGDDNARELVVRVIDEGAQMRHELAEENRLLQKRCDEEVESRHRAEMREALLEGRCAELERQIAAVSGAAKGH